MSFFTSLKYYRPTKPPLVTCANLAAFVRAFDELGLNRRDGRRSLELKFGRAVDRDRRSIVQMQPTGVPGLSYVGSLDMDIEGYDYTAESVAATLVEQAHRRLYRASVSLGPAAEGVVDALKHEARDDHDGHLCLGDWSLSLDREEVSSLGGDRAWHVGWIALSLSGNGYLFPRTLPELIELAEAVPGMAALQALCRTTWPVQRRRPGLRAVALRRAMGDSWPYARLTEPWDWYWGAHETG